jgi:predicted NUDIX family NTP pyrophosphohydrolase
MRQSCGLLLYRRPGGGRLQVFLVHPGGPLWARRDAGAWSIPKGEPQAGEDLLAAARREVEEETGVAVPGPFTALAPVRQAGGKRVHAWAVAADLDPARLRCNLARIEWPPRSGRVIEVPEVDRGAWFELAEARRRINPAQAALLDQLALLIG